MDLVAIYTKKVMTKINSKVTCCGLRWPGVTWDEVLSAVVDKNRQEIADPEVILAPKTNTIKS